MVVLIAGANMTNKGIRQITNLISLGYTGEKFFPLVTDSNQLDEIIATGEINLNKTVSIQFYDNPYSIISFVVYNHEFNGKRGYQLQIFETFGQTLESVSKDIQSDNPLDGFIRSLYFPSLQVISKLKNLLTDLSYSEFSRVINSNFS